MAHIPIMLRFGLFGIPVQVRWTFWLMTALLAYPLVLSKSPDAPVQFLAWAVAVFFSILWHELGHAVFQRGFGMRTEIELNHFGGLAKGSGRQLSQGKSLIMIAAGPGAGLLFGAALFAAQLALQPRGLWPDGGFFADLLLNLFRINIFWSIVNLAPVLPLDGGQIANTILGPGRARQTLKISIGAGIVMVIIGFMIQQSFMSMLFVFLTIQNVQRLQGINGPMFGAPPRRPF